MVLFPVCVADHVSSSSFVSLSSRPPLSNASPCTDVAMQTARLDVIACLPVGAFFRSRGGDQLQALAADANYQFTSVNNDSLLAMAFLPP
jgi:hypothetical protein